jgi:hypothetical protein
MSMVCTVTGAFALNYLIQFIYAHRRLIMNFVSVHKPACVVAIMCVKQIGHACMNNQLT